MICDCRAVNKEGESEPLTADQAILAKNPYDIPGKVDKPEVSLQEFLKLKLVKRGIPPVVVVNLR